jgi:tRNA (guanine37-N1)-methyltransferase
MKKIPQDLIGNIALLKFPRKTFWIIKKLKARKFLKTHKHITTVLEKTDKISGQLRIPKTKHLAGIKTNKATYKENNCTFKFDINKSYFSPRLSNERRVIAEEVEKLTKLNGPAPTNNRDKSVRVSKILVMFAGIGPYPITIAKYLRKSKRKFQIYSNELNKDANKSAKQNIILNKLQKQITQIPGDANKIKTKQKFDIILMPRPNLKDTFLSAALKLSKSGTTIFYHGFGTKQEVLEEIKKNTKKKIGKIKIRKAGDIGPYSFRWQVQFKIK